LGAFIKLPTFNSATAQATKPLAAIMKRHITAKLKQAQEKLGMTFSEEHFDFISKLEKEEVKFGEEEWLFWTVNDKPNDANDNFIIESSLNFKNEWGLDGLVFATNGIGDYLVVLPKELGDLILVMMHETAELKLFGKNIQDISQNGPVDYFWSDDYCYKLDDNDKLVKSENFNPNISSNKYSENYFGEDYELRSQLDDLIDDEKTEKISEILNGLERLSNSKDENHKVWAFNKLSDIYLRGFGPVPPDMTKALEYNQRAVDLNSHKAISNRAACYFFGLGMTKDINKALELATKANELSKTNQFADIFATKQGGGMYDKLVDMITTEIKNHENNSC
jgi:hypothetical protein